MSYPNLSALLEAIVYLAKEPVSLDAIRKALPDVDAGELKAKLDELIEQYRMPERGIEIREVADGYRFSTKPEHHETLKHFLKSQVPPTRLGGVSAQRRAPEPDAVLLPVQVVGEIIVLHPTDQIDELAAERRRPRGNLLRP